MGNLLEYFSDFLDIIFFNVIVPLFILLARGLELVLLNPLQMLHLPPALQVVWIAIVTAFLSIWLRRVFKVEKEEHAFKQKFQEKKKQQDHLHLISDWKSREKFAKAIDDDIDEDFNTYLAGRFVRYGLVYLLPIFLTLYWLESTAGYTIVAVIPENVLGLAGISSFAVFLVSYCITLFVFFAVQRKQKKRKPAAGQSICLT